MGEWVVQFVDKIQGNKSTVSNEKEQIEPNC